MSTLPDDVDARVDELYCRPLDRFVPDRDGLVKELRAEGRREEAAAVAKLAKPSVAAWAVNQVVRSQGSAAQALWEAGDAVLSGKDLRAAIAAQREALTPLADAARGMLTARGTFLNEQAVQQVVETLHAAAVDRAAREEVARGRLGKPLRLSGLGALPAMADGAAPRGAAPPAEEPAAPTAAEERRAAKARERALAAAQRRLDRAEQARETAADRVEARRADLAAAEAELAQREDEVRAAEAALDELEKPGD